MIVEQMLNNTQTPLLHIADVSGSALFQGDCLDIMPFIPDKSVQLILADLPYGTTQNKWDSIIDLDLLWQQYKRIVKDDGAIVLTATQPFTSKLVSSNFGMFKYDWCWKKPKGTGHLNAKKQPMRDKEDILVFYNKQCVYNPQMAVGTPYKDKAGKDHSKNTSMTDSYGKYTNYREINTGFRYPKQVLEFGVVERGTVHPTEKPLELMKYLISTYSNENDMVLDNTMGSGTTCLAAKELNRKFIGIEKEADYYEIACRRCGF
jgi:site-specific DNA-methyltransferase (adenine-specific)